MNVCSHEYRRGIHLGGCYLLSHKDNLMFVFCKVCILLLLPPVTEHSQFLKSQERVWLKVQWSTAKELRKSRQIMVSNQLHVEIILKKLKIILEHFDPRSFVCMTQLFCKLFYRLHKILHVSGTRGWCLQYHLHSPEKLSIITDPLAGGLLSVAGDTSNIQEH